ncbi:MAG TPA: hypothetical protein VGF55_32470 [Gemmataceae bacterium]
MAGLAQSALSFLWAQSLFGTQQLAGALAPPSAGRPARPVTALDAVAHVTAAELGGLLRQVYRVGDVLQRGAVNVTFDVLTGNALRPARQATDVLRQAADAARFVLAGQDVGLAWRELQNKLKVFQWVRNVEALLHLPADGSYVPVAELVGRAYELDPFPALWAVEGAGHYYADSLWGQGDGPRDLLTGPRAAAAPAKSLTMLHAGAGLAFAERLLADVTAATPADQVRAAVQRFLAMCRSNCRPGYVGAALESLGLYARVFRPAGVVPVVDRELAWLDAEALDYFWHGVGRALYFSPTYFLPFGRSAWEAVEPGRGEPPRERARRNAVAGLAWATTLVNMLRPEVMAGLVRRLGDTLRRDDAFANGVSSSIVMRQDTTPGEAFITSFCRHGPGGADADAWDVLVGGPCEQAVTEVHPALRAQGRLGEVFRYRSWADLAADGGRVRPGGQSRFGPAGGRPRTRDEAPFLEADDDAVGGARVEHGSVYPGPARHPTDAGRNR